MWTVGMWTVCMYVCMYVFTCLVWAFDSADRDVCNCSWWRPYVHQTALGKCKESCCHCCMLFCCCCDSKNLLNRKDYETVAATAAVDAVRVSAYECVDAGVGADAATCDGKSSDPAAVAPFSTTSSTLMFLFCFIFGTFYLNKWLTLHIQWNCNRLHLQHINLLFPHFSFIYIASGKCRYFKLKNNNSKQNAQKSCQMVGIAYVCADLAALFHSTIYKCRKMALFNVQPWYCVA